MMFEFGENKPPDLHREFINHLLQGLIEKDKINIEDKLNELNVLIICSLKSMIGSIDVSLQGTDKPPTDMIHKGIINHFCNNLTEGIKHMNEFFDEGGEFEKQKAEVISKRIVHDLFKDK